MPQGRRAKARVVAERVVRIGGVSSVQMKGSKHSGGAGEGLGSSPRAE